MLLAAIDSSSSLRVTVRVNATGKQESVAEEIVLCCCGTKNLLE